MNRSLSRLVLPAAALAAMLTPIGCAKSGPVEFLVATSENGAPIQDVRVEVSYPLRAAFKPRDFTVVTDEQGTAKSDVKRAPRIDVTIDHPGYRPLTQSLFADDVESWTIHRDPTLIISKHERPASFELALDEKTGDVAVSIHLEWEERPTHIVILPDDFRGLILLARTRDVPPLPESPAPRVFTTVAEPNGAALIPAWPIEQAPYERFRFFTQAGVEFPSVPEGAGGQYVAKLREGAETALFIVGNEADETTLRRAIWRFTTTGAANLNVENFALLVQMMGDSDTPITGRQVATALAN